MNTTKMTPERIAYLLEVDIATARMMAAAADMLAALDSVVGDLGDLTGYSTSAVVGSGIARARGTARAASDKATK